MSSTFQRTSDDENVFVIILSKYGYNNKSMKCKHCGEIHPAEFHFCPNTGNKIEPEKLVCKVCGSDNIQEGSCFCPYCGASLSNEPQNAKAQVTQNKFEDIQHIWSPKGLFWVKCKGKWGVMDSHMKEIVPCSLNIDVCDLEANDKYIAVTKVIETWNEEEDEITKFGYVDYQGNQVIPCIYDRAFISEVNDSFVLEKDGKCGVVNNKGLTIVPFKWDNIAYFSQGMAAVQMGGKCGYIDINGDVVVPLEYDETRNFVAGFASVKKSGKWGIIDAHNNVIIPFEYDIALTSSNEDEDDNTPTKQLFLVSKNSTWSIIDINGNVVCSIQGEFKSAWLYCNTIIQLFDEDDTCRFYRIDIEDFIEGYYKACSRLGKFNGTFYIRACTEQYDEYEEDLSYDYLIDIDENIIIESEEYNVCETPCSKGGLIRICQGDLYGVVDINGNLIIPCEYSRVDIDYYGKSIIAHREGALPVIFNSDGTILFSNM